MGKTTVRGASRPSMKVEAWPLDRIKPYAGNPRKISEAAVEKVAASLKKYGWRQPIVVCAAGEIVAGHTRKRAAELILERGESIPNWPDPAKAPVHPSGMDETEARAYRLADNRTGEEAEWNLDLLQFEFDALAEVDFELELTGFEASDWLSDEGEGLKIDVQSGEGASGCKGLYLSIDTYKIAMTEEEHAAIKALLDQYVEENGLDYGFVSHLCEAHHA